MAKKSKEKKEKKEKVQKIPLTGGDKLKIKRKKEGKSTKKYKTQARYEELFNVTRELIRRGEVENEKEASELLSRVTDYSKNYIRYNLLPKKAPEDIREKLGLKEKKEKTEERAEPQTKTEEKEKTGEKEELQVKPEEFKKRKKRAKEKESPLEEFKETWREYREGEVGKIEVIKSIPGKIPKKTGEFLEKEIKGIGPEEAEKVSAKELWEKAKEETGGKNLSSMKKIDFEVEEGRREKEEFEIEKPAKAKKKIEDESEEDSEEETGESGTDGHEVNVTGAGAGGGGAWGFELSSKKVKIIAVFLFILIIISAIASLF